MWRFLRSPYNRGQSDRYIDSLFINRQTVLNMRNIQNINIRCSLDVPVRATRVTNHEAFDDTPQSDVRLEYGF